MLNIATPVVQPSTERIPFLSQLVTKPLLLTVDNCNNPMPNILPLHYTNFIFDFNKIQHFNANGRVIASLQS